MARDRYHLGTDPAAARPVPGPGRSTEA